VPSIVGVTRLELTLPLHVQAAAAARGTPASVPAATSQASSGMLPVTGGSDRWAVLAACLVLLGLAGVSAKRRASAP
jgi:LPXTG-motif cell wall-anchored protein